MYVFTILIPDCHVDVVGHNVQRRALVQIYGV